MVMMVALVPALHVAPAHAMGLLPVRVDTVHGRILLTLASPSKHGTDGRYLYATSLQAGLGSAAIMLDRGFDGRTQLLEFRRIGTDVAIAFENTRFRAVGGSPAVRAGVSESVPIDVVWMVRPVTIKPAGSVVIDIASFLPQDVMHRASQLDAGGGAPPTRDESGIIREQGQAERMAIGPLAQECSPHARRCLEGRLLREQGVQWSVRTQACYGVLQARTAAHGSRRPRPKVKVSPCERGFRSIGWGDAGPSGF